MSCVSCRHSRLAMLRSLIIRCHHVDWRETWLGCVMSSRRVFRLCWKICSIYYLKSYHRLSFISSIPYNLASARRIFSHSSYSYHYYYPHFKKYPSYSPTTIDSLLTPDSLSIYDLLIYHNLSLVQCDSVWW